MKGLQLLPVSQETKNLIIAADEKQRVENKVSAHILSVKGKIVTIRVMQLGGQAAEHFLSKGELINIAQGVFDQVEMRSFRLMWRPIVHGSNKFSKINAKWVKTEIERRNLKELDVVKDMGVDEKSLEQLLSGQYEFRKWHKAAFYFYFKCKDDK